MKFLKFNRKDKIIDQDINDFISLTQERQLPLDIIRHESELVVICPLPGTTLENIDIIVHNETLTIRGKGNYKFIAAADKYLVRECQWGDLSRSIVLPLPVNANDAQATFDEGVLVVTLPITKNMGDITVKKLAL